MQKRERTYSLALAVSLGLWQVACASGQQQQQLDDSLAQNQVENDGQQEQGNSQEFSNNANSNAEANNQAVSEDNGAASQQQQQVASNNAAMAQENATDMGDFGVANTGGNGAANGLGSNAAASANLIPADGGGNAESINAAPVDADIAEAVSDPAVQEDITEPVTATPAAAPLHQATANAAPNPAPAAAAPLVSHDILPINYGTLQWVGYKFDLKAKQLLVDMVTSGAPQYEVFQEQNRAQQPELIIRFLETGLRRKIRRDIDASEFRSPVAYIRMREDEANRHVDVVLTLRDPIQPKLFAKNGNLRLTYALPPKYLGNLDAIAGDILGEALSLKPGPILPKIDSNSDAPKRMAAAHVFVPNPAADAFQTAPVDGGIPLEKAITPPVQVDDKGLPASFGKDDELVPLEESEPSIDGEFHFDPGADLTPAEQAAFGIMAARSFSIAAVAHAAPTAMTQPKKPAGNKVILLAQANGIPDNGGMSFNNNAAGGGGMNAAAANMMPVTEPNPTADASGGGGEIEGQEQEGAAPARQYSGRPMSIQFNKAPLSLVLQTFGEESGNNFILKEELGTKLVTLNFKNVPWDEALVGVLETHGLGMVKVGTNVIRIDTVQELAKSLTDIKLTKQAEEEAKPTKILIVRLNNADAPSLVTPIQTMLSSQGNLPGKATVKIMADTRTNSIVAEAPPEYLARIKAIVERLDLETPQVEIASRIVEVSRDNNNLFGIMWETALNFDPGRAMGFGSLPFPNSVRSNYSIDTGVKADVFKSNFRFGSLNNMLNLDAFLAAEESKGTTSILQSNKVIVVDRQDAMIKASKTIYVKTTVYQSGVPIVIDQPRTFDLKMTVNPKISNNGYVMMNLKIGSSTPTSDGMSSSDRAVDTVMARRSGETGVIGGIYDTSKIHKVKGVPWLSRLPIIGALFRSEQTQEVQTELLVMITPTILDRSGSGSQGGGASQFKNFTAGNSTNASVLQNNGMGNSAGNSEGATSNAGGNNAAMNNGGNLSNGGNQLGNNGNVGNNVPANGDNGAGLEQGNVANPQSEGNMGTGSQSFDNTSANQNAGEEVM